MFLVLTPILYIKIDTALDRFDLLINEFVFILLS
jgi:hypothetical protein